MEQREKLIWMLSLLMNPQEAFVPTTAADYLIEHGVIVLPCRCGDCINRHDEVICPMVISHESFDEDDGYDVWYEDLTTDDFYCANGERKGGDKL